MPIEIKFTGGRELARALQGLGSEISGRLGQNAVRAGARSLAKAAKGYAPVSPGGGALRDSIRTFDDVGLRRAGGRERSAYVGTRLFYAYFVEFGTVHMPAQSFIRRALDQNNQEAFDKMAENLAGGIDREAAKYR